MWSLAELNALEEHDPEKTCANLTCYNIATYRETQGLLPSKHIPCYLHQPEHCVKWQNLTC